MESREYLSKVLIWLNIEKEEDLKQYRERIRNKSLKERVNKGYTWYPLGLKRVRISTGERLLLELERNAIIKAQSIQSGDTVSVFGLLSGHEVGRITGVVAYITSQMMKVMLGTSQLPDWISKAQLGVDVDFDDKTYQEMEKAVRGVIEAKKGSRLMELRETILGKRKAEFHRWNITHTDSYLNDSQNEAVQRILESLDVAIVHGPPGTGKTTTLVRAIKETLKREHQVLVCAPSNTAVDLLTLKCYEAGIYVVRIGNPARVEETLHQLTLDGQIASHEDYASLKKMRKEADNYRKRASKFKRNFDADARHKRQTLLREANELRKLAFKLEDYIIHHVLTHNQVIATTLTGSAHSVLGNKRFHTVFIDEAAQALSSASWIPILRSNRVILAGDHYQLPPTVKSMEAAKEGLSKTLFEKIMNEKEAHVSVLLTDQYRMHERIMRFSSDQFYKGRLRAHPSVKDRRLGENIEPVEFIDTAGCGFEEKKHPETLSRFNDEEAHLLLRHIALLFNKLKAQDEQFFSKPFSLGIISPYKEQVAVIRKQWANSPMLSQYDSYVSINTIDGFQGQERDVIYISLVRSNNNNDIGFLKDIRRMNVALTRARKKLVVFGDSATLGEHPFYESLLHYMEEINAYKSGWEYLNKI